MREEWRPVVGYEGHYFVSSVGNVWSEKTSRLMKSQPQMSGHLGVNLCLNGVKKRFTVHSLVATSFIGPRPIGYEVCHENGIETDNRLLNRSYGTHRDNKLDAYRHGSLKVGEQSHLSKVSDVTILKVKSMKGLVSSRIAAIEVGLSGSHIRRIWRGESRRYVNA